MKLLIKITKEVLEKTMLCSTNGFAGCANEADFARKRGVGFNCAVGYAVSELLPHAWTARHEIRIYKTFIEMKTETPSYLINLPPEATMFINKFDQLVENPERRLQMKPISFEVTLPDGLIDEIGISEVHKILSTSSTMELI